MAHKQLKASVKLDTQGTEQKLRNIAKAIDAINRAAGQQSNTYTKVNNALNRGVTQTKQVTAQTHNWANAVNKVNSGLNKTGSHFGFIATKLKHLASAYLGVMGAKAMIDTSDIITSSENRLNNLNGGDTQATQESMDKMYVSSQKVRTGYGDMMANVSKSMTLAGDAFQGNIDNAIRFQEIMSEAYTIGGASAAEQASSMYQMIQALGSGILQGDELRSIREGAPIAYKAIEEFAQGVYKTEDSLKDLASQGLITSEIVVAAMMEAGEGIDKAFEDTDMTFAQAFTNMKNVAIKAFEPVMQAMNDALNSDMGQSAILGLSRVIVILANAILWVMDVFAKFFNWFADNWYWIQWIVYSVIAILIIHLGMLAAKAIWTGITTFWAFLTGLSPLYLWIIVIGLVVIAMIWMTNIFGSLCEAIYQIAMWLAIAIIGILLVVAMVYIATGTLMMGIPILIGLVILGVLAILVAAFMKFTGAIVGGLYGIQAVSAAIFQNIGIWFNNLCSNMSAAFWDWIADMCEGFDWLLSAINAVAGWFGKDTITIEGLRKNADAARSEVQEYVDISATWDSAYAEGYAVGEGIQDKINSFGDKLKNFSLSDKLKLDDTSDLFNFGANTDLGSNYNSPALALTLPEDPSKKLGGSGGSGYDPKKALSGIKGDTGKIADSMDLTEEDLQYLRDVANMEWKREYTTANITVDMSNYNTINGETDLDGIVTKLSDKLYEEMDYLANGVY